ncbi:hypothetical protein TVAG_198880 [Trichomonas vaginalis G3]|uniref:Uncharacterized protein n=1 Tax=Trichomonas vaginalis (strain ATCC PRA-98 / G3) TaxID=412133 RepID=A2DDS3_TRIV3|nr:hypothetical protein TVAGG3_0999340 [Trichomonas vaginalis G3]EAY21449.1 hypothetical protein TVAG_198880 [Trichomonas vaginalis G3]KAI5490662.1 hypothetical protein TVAGG3_0999340 [Trichomonas vaginalis G3]|eukprot:XP_001582435.1 hypothetical protein [Trichomonas vaginalis G3]
MDYIPVIYWISLFIGGGSLSALSFMVSLRHFPSIINILSYPPMSSLYLVFTLVNTPMLAFIFYHTFTFYQKSRNRVSPSVLPKYDFLAKSFVLCGAIFVASLLLMVFFKPQNEIELHYLFIVAISMSAVSFSYLSDFIYAMVSKMMIPLSMTVNHISCALTAVTYILCLLSHTSKVIKMLFGFLQIMSFSLYYTKIFFLGVTCLGARFLDVQIDLLAKHQQTILPSSFNSA